MRYVSGQHDTAKDVSGESKVKRTADVQQEYDEDKFENLVYAEIDSGVMVDVSLDSDQPDHFVSQFKSRIAEHAEAHTMRPCNILQYFKIYDSGF